MEIRTILGNNDNSIWNYLFQWSSKIKNLDCSNTLRNDNGHDLSNDPDKNIWFNIEVLKVVDHFKFTSHLPIVYHISVITRAIFVASLVRGINLLELMLSRSSLTSYSKFVGWDL